MKYKESNPFYHSAAWRRVRAMAIERDKGMCRDCMELFEAGIMMKPRRATMVHHLQSVEDRPDLALNLDNLISLCDMCHNKRHPEKGRGDGDKNELLRGMRVIRV